MEPSGKVLAVCISERKGTMKHPVSEAQLRARHGIEGDAHAGPWHRQVSLLATESVEPMRAVLPELPAPYRLYREYRYGKIRLSVYHRSGNEDEAT